MPGARTRLIGGLAVAATLAATVGAAAWLHLPARERATSEAAPAPAATRSLSPFMPPRDGHAVFGGLAGPPREAEGASLAVAPPPAAEKPVVVALAPVPPADRPLDPGGFRPPEIAPLPPSAPPRPTLLPEIPLPPGRPPELKALLPPGPPPPPAPPPAAAPVVPSAPPPEIGLPPPAPSGPFAKGQPAYVRIFKQEGQLELWLKRGPRYALFKTFSICKWSGKLGPKVKEGDYQSPEGFYNVTARQLNPNSQYHLAFNVGYPNAYDRQHGRTGSALMVHGDCQSVGCYAMTDKGIEEIYGYVEAALRNGQREVPVHIFPFRMTSSAIAREAGGGGLASLFGGATHAGWGDFWRNLKEGYDLFERTGEPPAAYACNRRYVFGAAGAGCARIAGW
ncbi:MAG: hypothetical protein JNK46_03690 [Methylobacteriaceae bacterium]|nr:hypothetical protein [Methylobacteriaceae bacterium]